MNEKKVVQGVIEEALPDLKYRVLISDERAPQESWVECLDHKCSDNAPFIDRPSDLSLHRHPPMREIMAYTAGKLKLHKIRILVGDRVRVELDPYGGKATNRIIFRI